MRGECQRRWLITLACISVATVGCAPATDVLQVSSPKSFTREAIRQTDDQGRRMPFETKHDRRWNRANDGSPYEPCTALSSLELHSLGVDASTVRDAAGTNGQTLRGCRWNALSTGRPIPWSISQFVGNSEGLADDKKRRSTAIDVWFDDVVVEGRVVGVHRMRDGFTCDTYVQSGRAGVSTLVVHLGPTLPPPAEICDRALEFTRATISKMPL